MYVRADALCVLEADRNAIRRRRDMKTGTLLMAVPAGLAASVVASVTIGATAATELSPGAVAGVVAQQQAAGVEWFWSLNGPVSADAGVDLSVDAKGNVFLAGSHGGLDMDRDGIVDFASRATAYEGAKNPLFMKLGRSSPGEPMRILWARSPGTPADRSQTKVAADGRGGTYASGAFMESLSFEDGPTLEGAGGNDAFIARYDGEGSVLWARVFGGPGANDAIHGLASDGVANAYVVGTGSGTFPLDDHGGEFRTAADRAAAVVSWGPDGSLRWSHVFGAGVTLAFGVRVAANGQAWVTGEMEGAADFDGDGTADLPAPKDRDGFVARFGPDGVLLGAWRTPGPAMPAFAADGDVFLTGAMGGPLDQRYGPADFNGDGRPDVELKGGGPTGAWIARYSVEGDLRWVRSYSLEQPADMEVRGDMIALSGNYKGVRDLDEDGVAERVDRTVDPSLETDLAVMILSARDGRPIRVWIAPGPGNDWANAVAFLPNEPSLLVTGAIQLTADFTGDGKDGEGWIVCENRGDIYVAQYSLPEPPAADREERRREITLDVSVAVREGALRARLEWSGAKGDRVDVYRNGELIATVENNGLHSDLIPRDRVSAPYRYRVCESGTDTCSATWEGGG
jgi:Beta-propeller repeat